MRHLQKFLQYIIVEFPFHHSPLYLATFNKCFIKMTYWEDLSFDSISNLQS
jgi:hypothetical protein